MQDRYVGDIGDYLKLGILRALSPGYRLGIAWWLYPDESHNRDGRHIGYLHRPDQWRHYDPKLFDALAQIVSTARGTFGHWKRPVFFPEQSMPGRWSLSVGHVGNVRGSVTDGSAGSNPLLRTPISCSLTQTMDLSLRYRSAKAGKSVLLTELHGLARPGRCLIVYHHQSRRKGGHQCEIVYWAERLRAAGFATVDALRARPYSPRVYFLLNAPFDIQRRAKQIAVDWQGWITWHPGRSQWVLPSR